MTSMPPSRSILILEDEPSFREVLQLGLSPQGFSPETVGTLEGAKVLLRERNFDAIVSDLRLKDGSGIDLLTWMKAEGIATPVVIMTAFATTETTVQALNLGAVDFVTKPFRPPVLKARVRTHLEIAQQRKMLQLLSHSDGLTGTANRRFFGAQLEREFMRLQRLGEPLSLVMIDVDHFKAYNDHYGHLVGDECLSQLSQAIQGALHRPGDLLARYGGEEFVCLLPHTALDGAVLVAQGIVDALRALDLPHAASPLGHALTVSLGVASMAPSPDNSADQLLADADRRLYLAKNAGRDRIVWAG